MGRYRSRSRSYSPQRSRSPLPLPPRSSRSSKRGYDDEPRESYHRGSSSHRSYGSDRDRDRDSRRSSGPTGLLIRNISLDARVEDLRTPFERFGPVKDVYLPKNYYTGEPRGFGFVKFRNADDAAEAKHQMNHQVIGGREITIVYAEENRKTPQEMRKTTRVSSGRHGGGGNRRRSPPRSPRRRNRSYSRSPSPARRESRVRDHGSRGDDYSPRRPISRSPGRSISRSPGRSISKSPRRPISKSPRRPISRSPPPRDERDYGSDRRSLSPPPAKVQRSRSHEKKDYRPDQRSPSPEAKGHSPPRSSHDARDYVSDRRSLSPGDNGQTPSKSRSPSHSP
ncbi:hypothetical protein MKX01_014743 [Papaver californicum]|nr:hypothetical protein MKX01_014743 [Papaver californicum]